MPYLPVDPADLGRTYEEVIRVNSQSGKGGISFLLEQEYGISLPRRLQIEFSGVVQSHTDDHGKEMAAADIFSVFRQEYLEKTGDFQLIHYHLDEDSHRKRAAKVDLDMLVGGKQVSISGTGEGPVEAFINAMDWPVMIMDYHEHAIGSGADAEAIAYVELRVGKGERPPP